MIELVRSAVEGQYGAALAMFRDCLNAADAETWAARVGRAAFWHVAYHTLFITDLYLSPEEKAFRPQPFHREDYEMMGPAPWAPEKVPVVDRPYDLPTLAGYADTCRAKARRTVDAETDAVLAGPSGFDWLPFTRLELHLYNIRHLQHHTGQLTAALRRQRGEGVTWASSERL